jgi:hypothetical protein
VQDDLPWGSLGGTFSAVWVQAAGIEEPGTIRLAGTVKRNCPEWDMTPRPLTDAEEPWARVRGELGAERLRNGRPLLDALKRRDKGDSVVNASISFWVDGAQIFARSQVRLWCHICGSDSRDS